MNKIENILELNPYSYKFLEKKKIFDTKILELTNIHQKKCKLYSRILKSLNFNKKTIKNYWEIPFLPVKIFKEFDMKSIKDKDIFKTLKSSGTSGGEPSKIYLDKFNASNQSKVLTKIMTNTLGKNRLPMLIIDKNPILSDRKIFSASLAAIYGFSFFGKNHTYLLNENNEIDYEILNSFLKKFSKNNFLVFGFTSKIFQNLIVNLKIRKVLYNFSNATLLHGGGWKKLEKNKINNKKFKYELSKKLKLKKAYNYYGLVEQTGSIFIESDSCGFFHTSNFSDLIIRDQNFNIVKNRTKGLIQLISLLPTSYPGHSILTEDVGEIIGQDDCKCGRVGKYFLVHGRAKQAEVRGCSDT